MTNQEKFEHKLAVIDAKTSMLQRLFPSSTTVDKNLHARIEAEIQDMKLEIEELKVIDTWNSQK